MKKRLKKIQRVKMHFKISKHMSTNISLYCIYPWNSPGKNTGVGSHSLLQGIFPTPGLNLSHLHCRHVLYHLSHQGSLIYIWVYLNDMLILKWLDAVFKYIFQNNNPNQPILYYAMQLKCINMLI